MSQTTVNLGYVLINRGEYVADPVTKYYKDNVVQYLGSAFIAAPVDYDEETNPLAYVTVAPYDTDPNKPNEGWKVFASDAAYVNSFMFFTENPEWVYVVCDKEDKILFGVKQDAEFYFGAGVPPQVQEYVMAKIQEFSPENYDQVIAFLQDLLGTDTTLKMMLDAMEAEIQLKANTADVQIALEQAAQATATALEGKVDKEEGKSLIDAEYASTKSHIDNPEFLSVTTDQDNKVLEGIQKDGTKVIGGDLEVGGSARISGDVTILGNVELNGASYTVCESPEWIKVLVDAENKILCGIKRNGKFVADIEGGVSDTEFQVAIAELKAYIDSQDTTLSDRIAKFEEIFSVIEDNPEYIDVKTDSEDKILEATRVDGTKVINTDLELNGKLNQQGVVIKVMDNPEYIDAKTDSDDKLLEATKKNGTKVIGGDLEIGGDVVFKNGVPQQIIDYVAEHTSTGTGVESLEYDDATGDMYATYDDESGVTDVYMEPNGDIYVESEE